MQDRFLLDALIPPLGADDGFPRSDVDRPMISSGLLIIDGQGSFASRVGLQGKTRDSFGSRPGCLHVAQHSSVESLRFLQPFSRVVSNKLLIGSLSVVKSLINAYKKNLRIPDRSFLFYSQVLRRVVNRGGRPFVKPVYKSASSGDREWLSSVAVQHKKKCI
jgi:hypothetical protein